MVIGLFDSELLPDVDAFVFLDPVELAEVHDVGAFSLGDSGEAVTAPHLIIFRSRGGAGWILEGSQRLLVGHAIMGMAAEIVLLERERFGTQCPILEIEDTLGVEGLAFVACLEMEMGSGAATSAASIANHVASSNGVAAMNQGLLQMSIVGLKSIEVSNDDKVAVTSRMFRWHDDPYHTIKSGVNVVTDTQRDVYTFVGMSSTIFESRTHLPSTWEAVDMQRVNQQKVDRIGQR